MTPNLRPVKIALEIAPGLVLVPVYKDADSPPQLFDIFYRKEWQGSRRTIAQCREQMKL